MHESFLKDIALVLGVAAVMSALSHKLRIPSIVGYLFAGLIIGPYIPIPLFADLHRVESLSEFGVILVMFSVGLEFNLEKFFRVLPTSGITAALEIGAMFMVGVSVGYMFNWPVAQSIFMGGALAISSTMVVSKIFEEIRPTAATREHVFGVLVVQDVVAILLLTILGAYAVTNHLSFDIILPTVAKLLFIFLLLTVIGLFIVPKFIRYISLQKNSEVLIIVSVGLCFVLALVVESLGYSVALGAFLAGVLVAESGAGSKVERLSKPLKDVFVAIFFVSIGMTVDPIIAVSVLPQSIFVALLVIFSQFLIVFAGGILSGIGMTRSLFSSLALGQIGEFSFIIVAIGANAGMVTKEFQAIVVTVAILTSFSSPLLWRNAKKIVEVVSKIMPSQMRIVIGLYEAWFNRIRAGRLDAGRLFGIPKKVLIGLVLDSLLLVIIPPLFFKFLPGVLEKIGIYQGTLAGSIILFVLLASVLMPVLYGFVKMSSALIIKLSQALFSVSLEEEQTVSSAERLFKLTIWSILCLIVSFPLLAFMGAFLNSYLYATLILLVLATILYRLWVSAGKVVFEYEAGGEKLISVIKRQTFSKDLKVKKVPTIPGLSDLLSIEIHNQKIEGKTLAEMDIRNLSGATIVSIERSGKLIMFPSQTEALVIGDVLHVWGSDEAKKMCKEMLK